MDLFKRKIGFFFGKLSLAWCNQKGNFYSIFSPNSYKKIKLENQQKRFFSSSSDSIDCRNLIIVLRFHLELYIHTLIIFLHDNAFWHWHKKIYYASCDQYENMITRLDVLSGEKYFWWCKKIFHPWYEQKCTWPIICSFDTFRINNYPLTVQRKKNCVAIPNKRITTMHLM